MQSFVERRTFVATSRTRGFVVENLSSLNDSLYMFLIVNEWNKEKLLEDILVSFEKDCLDLGHCKQDYQNS